MHYFTSLLGFAALALAASRTSAPSGALVVGSSGKYSTIQAAVDALSSTSKEQVIFIQPGTYKEQVYIKKLSGPVTIYGYTEDDTSYSSNQVVITAAGNLLNAENDDATATLRIWTENFKMYNVNVVNSCGEGSQALALSAYAGEGGYYACQFIGYQDTVLAESGTQLYARSYIEGAVDFIFGQTADAWFEQVDIGVIARSYGTITASGRASADNGYYVINNSTVAAAPNNDVVAGSYYLGRPWRDYARVVFQDTSMTDVINSAGWTEWQSSEPNTDHVTFAEYGNTGAGAKGTRASFASKLSAPLAMADVLGSDYADWVDAAYIS